VRKLTHKNLVINAMTTIQEPFLPSFEDRIFPFRPKVMSITPFFTSGHFERRQRIWCPEPMVMRFDPVAC